MKRISSFTLIELVIVIGILSVLAAVAVIIINPAQKMAEARDAQRMSDLNQIQSSIGLYLADGKSGIGSTNIVYVSMPDASSTCANLGLPSLPGGWAYQCSTSANYRKTDGTGWIPIDFTQISFGNVVQTLPVDPVNATSSGFYYTYVTGGSYQLSALFESSKYNLNLTSEYYSVGTNNNLLPTLTVVSSAGVVMNLSMPNGYAFITNSSLNLAPYLNKYITISDGTNSISGFVKAQGTGETYATSIWASFDFTNWNILTYTVIDTAVTYHSTSGGNLIGKTNGSALINSVLYRGRLIGSASSGTVSLKNQQSRVTFATGFSTYGYGTQGASDAAGIAITGTALANYTVTAIDLQQVLTPATTGVTITNTRGGGTYNWVSAPASFNPNAASFTVTISP